MPQFDVHESPGRRREIIPFVVVVQSSRFDVYARRVVVPLVRRARFGAIDSSRLNPSFTVKGIGVVLHPLEIVTVSSSILGRSVASLAAHSEEIVDALDQLLTRVHG